MDDTQTKPQPPDILKGVFKSKEDIKLKEIKKEQINILSLVTITYKTEEGRKLAISHAIDKAKRDTKRYGGDDSFTATFEATEYVQVNKD